MQSIKKCTHALETFLCICVKSCHAISLQNGPLVTRRKSTMAMKNAPGLEKLMCPVCWSILIEPVTLPCKHHLCRECFDGSMEMANLTCPLCRKRVGAWMRQGKKGGLVNAQLWKHIQANYADYISIKQRGGDDGLNDCEF